MSEKICPVCGKKFTAANASRYCSDQCRTKNKKKKNKPMRTCICRNCGTTFTSVRRKRYCTEDCRMIANGRGVSPFTKKEKPKPRYSLAQVAAMANAEGLTYGSYVQKYNL